jgi:hypothetical protein
MTVICAWMHVADIEYGTAPGSPRLWTVLQTANTTGQTLKHEALHLRNSLQKVVIRVSVLLVRYSWPLDAVIVVSKDRLTSSCLTVARKLLLTGGMVNCNVAHCNGLKQHR